MTDLHTPFALLLLLLLPLTAWLVLRRKNISALKFSSLNLTKHCKPAIRTKLKHLPLALRLLCLTLLIFALARPRHGTQKTVISNEGIAIQLVVDTSGSMAEEIDFFGEKTNKLQAVKQVVKQFLLGDDDQLSGRAADLVGLVTYATYPETICPLVRSHDILVEFLERAQPIQHRQLGNTAIGDALALAAARQNQAETEIQNQASSKNIDPNDTDFKIKSKIIILLTDGKQNAGEYSPTQAAQLAKKWGIKIYSIALAADQYRQSLFGTQKIPAAAQVDNSMLQNIADMTDGKYFLASDAKTLKQIYETIDQLEKSEIESIEYLEYAEKFTPFALAALIILLIEIITKTIILKKIP